MNFPVYCPICGLNNFHLSEVLWPELILEWGLAPNEVDYINRQQGLSCKSCGNNLRSMCLGEAVLKEMNYVGTLSEFCSSGTQMKILEINKAGALTAYFENISNHRLVEFSESDMQNLNFEDGSFDLVVHSDTIEHVPDPVQGLKECYRLLKNGGSCIFTTPIIIGRLTKSRVGLLKSYHGDRNRKQPDQLVCTEFGVDFWTLVFEAGFQVCELFAFEYPAAMAVIARKI